MSTREFQGVCKVFFNFLLLNPFVIWIESVCLCVLHNVWVCVCAHTFFFFCRRLLERITSFKEYEIQHLLKSDTLWHCFEAMKVRLERHGSSFLSMQSWVYVIGSRPVKSPLKRFAPEGKTKLPLKAFHLYLFYDPERSVVRSPLCSRDI